MVFKCAIERLHTEEQRMSIEVVWVINPENNLSLESCFNFTKTETITLFEHFFRTLQRVRRGRPG